MLRFDAECKNDGKGLILLGFSGICGWLRLWWNWQTRYFEVVVGQPVQVQVLLCAPCLKPADHPIRPARFDDLRSQTKTPAAPQTRPKRRQAATFLSDFVRFPHPVGNGVPHIACK